MALNMPTQASVGRNSHAASINDFNLQMRQQPWYQDWFQQQGLDPNRVHLSQGQRKALQQVILQKGGVPPDAFNDMKIDPAGNLNTEHGFASQPTWLKTLEIAGAAAAGGFGASAALGGSAAAGGAGAATGSSAAAAGAGGVAIPTITGTAYGTGMAAAAPSLAGGAAAAGAGGTGLATLQLGGRLANGILQTRAQNRAAQADFGLASDRNQLAAANMRMNAEGGRERQLVGADLLGSMKPPSDPRAQPYLSGSQVDPATIAMVRDRATRALTSGGDVPPMSTLPKPGKMDTFLNALNYAGTGLEAWKKFGGGF